MKIGHFATDYKRLVAGLRGRSDEATAMARAVGGSYDAIGQMSLTCCGCTGCVTGCG